MFIFMIYIFMIYIFIICIVIIFIVSALLSIASSESILRSQISIDDLVLYVFFAAFRWKGTKEIRLGLEIEIEWHSKYNTI